MLAFHWVLILLIEFLKQKYSEEIKKLNEKLDEQAILH